MRFDVKNTTNGKRDREKRGTATTSDGGDMVVDLLAPERRQFLLPRGTLFPTAQVAALVGAASHGQSKLRGPVFQGGDEHDFYDSTALIGHAAPPGELAAERAVDAAGLIRNVPAWKLLVSYFADRRGADLPDYEVASRLYANGVSGSMLLVYSRYTLRATLTRLEPLLPSCGK